MQSRESSALQALFYAVFDNTRGPVLQTVAPAGWLSADAWAYLAGGGLVVAAPPLAGRVVAQSLPAALAGPGGSRADSRVLSFSAGLRHERYERNSLLFAVGLVLRGDGGDASHGEAPARASAPAPARAPASSPAPASAPPRADAAASSQGAAPWEAVLRKLGLYLFALELESGFLCGAAGRAALARVLPAILHGLSARGECFVAARDCDAIALKLFPQLPPPRAVRDAHVPVRVRDLDAVAGAGAAGDAFFAFSGLDACVRALLPHIDGRAHVRAIAEAADADLPLVRRALQHLLFYGCIALVDTFQFANVYAATPRAQLLLRAPELAHACARAVAAEPAPHAPPAAAQPPAHLGADAAFRLYAAFGAGSRVADVCVAAGVEEAGADARRLVAFGVMHGLLRRIHSFPVRTAAAAAALAAVAAGAGAGDAEPAAADGAPLDAAQPPPPPPPRARALLAECAAWLDGRHSLEDICCELRCSQDALVACLEAAGFEFVQK
jgi:hypothetical protein